MTKHFLVVLPFLLTAKIFANSSKVAQLKDILGLEEPDPSFLHHIRNSRTHANKFIIAKLMEQVRKSSEKITKPTIKKCEVEKEQLGRVRGVCTPQGSCQVLGNHFVFQGGCGEASRWGTVRVPENVPCFMIVFHNEKVTGHCTMGGHCWTRHETKLLHPDCREQSEQNHQISTRSTEYQKN